MFTRVICAKMYTSTIIAFDTRSKIIFFTLSLNLCTPIYQNYDISKHYTMHKFKFSFKITFRNLNFGIATFFHKIITFKYLKITF